MSSPSREEVETAIKHALDKLYGVVREGRALYLHTSGQKTVKLLPHVFEFPSDVDCDQATKLFRDAWEYEDETQFQESLEELGLSLTLDEIDSAEFSISYSCEVELNTGA